jgi:hypothetical protein
VTPTPDATPTPTATPGQGGTEGSPAAGGSPAAAQAPAKVAAGRATLTGPRSVCVRKAFTVSVRGRSIARVRFSIDGRTVRTVTRATRGRYALTIKPASLSTRVHVLRARVEFVSGSGTAAITRTLRFERCITANPRFTG